MKSTRKTNPKIVDKQLKEFQVLSENLDNASYDSQAMAYVLLKIATSGKKPALINEIMDGLYLQIGPVYKDGKNTAGLDFECDIAPVREWLAFLDGMSL